MREAGMLDTVTGPVGVGIAWALVLLGYGVIFVQIRRRFPDRWTTYAFEFATTGVGAAVGSLFSGDAPLMWACIPLTLFAIGLVAGKGSIAVLVHVPAEGTDMSAETRRARTRFGWLLTSVLTLFAVVYVVVA
jgi:hypothetical protein